MTNAEFIVSKKYFKYHDDSDLKKMQNSIDDICSEYFDAIGDDEDNTEIIRCMALEIYMLREKIKASRGSCRL